MRVYRGGEREGARAMMEAAMLYAGSGTAPGSVAIIGSPDRASDLLTLRAVERFQEPNVVFHDSEARSADRIDVPERRAVNCGSGPGSERQSASASLSVSEIALGIPAIG